MSDVVSRRIFNRKSRWLPLLLAGILFLGLISAWWLAVLADREVREELLKQANMVAEGLNLERLRVFKNTELDIQKPEYLRIKKQMEKVLTVYTDSRFIYLLGRKDDGTVFFYVDSEPLGSPDESPAGQVYSEFPDDFLKVFDTKTAMSVGPFTDRWGAWITAFVPVIDPLNEELLGVLGMDMDTAIWRERIIKQSVLPAGIFTLALMAIVLVSFFIARRRYFLKNKISSRMVYLEPASIFMAGMVITLFIAWIAQSESEKNQFNAFSQVADSRSKAFVKTLSDLRDIDLEGLALFYNSSDEVTAEQFRSYTEYLTKNRTVHAWAWLPAVPASEKEEFEAEVRASGMEGFEIWELTSDGYREVVSGRDFYYPVLRVAPEERVGEAVGFDLGSEPRRRQAIEDAITTKMITATEPLKYILEEGDKESMIFFRPLFADEQGNDLEGFAVALVQLSDKLPPLADTYVIGEELYLAHPDSEPELLYSNHLDFSNVRAELSLKRPFFGFGKLFFIAAHAGPGFFDVQPAHGGLTPGIIGFLLTSGISLMVAMVLRRREELEKMVDERTAALNTERDRLNNILKITGTGINIIDSDYNLLFVNEGWESIYGNYNGRKCYEYYMDKAEPCLGCGMPEALQKKEIVITEKIMPKENNKIVEIHTVPFQDTDGSWRAAEFNVDITKRKKGEEAIEAEREQLLALLNSMDEAIYISDPFTYELLYVNPHLSVMLPKDCIGSKCYKVLQGFDKPCSFCTNEIILSQKPEAYRWEYYNKYFDRYYSLVDKIIKWSDGRDVRFEMAIDVTLIKKAEKLLAAKNKELEQIIFVASHDLRSPLVNVEGFSRELEYSLQDIENLFAEKKNSIELESFLSAELSDVKSSIDRIRKSVHQMDNLLKGLLKLSRSGRSAIKVTTVDMNNLMENVVSSMSYRIREAGVEVELGDLPSCKGDVVQLTQVFSNLLDNALKYRHKERKGIVKINGSFESGRSVYRVEDNGIGIAENHQKNIFELFHRLDPGETEGDGLGLTIAKQILGRLEGNIAVESLPGKGSVFIVNLPFAPKD